MARVGFKQRQQIKLVLVFAHMPETTFQVKDCEGSHSMPVSPIPCEEIILELKLVVWNTRFDDELWDFIKIAPHWFESQRKQALALCYNYNSNVKVGRRRAQIDVMLDDAVDRMPRWLSDKAQTIAELNLKGIEYRI
jgi:hypothetical protein